MNQQKNYRSAKHDQTIDGGNHRTDTRRRGEILESAILQASWDELNKVGYAHLTMEGVAARAMTNKNAVYRRWPSKSELVIATISKYLPKPASTVPDTGDLRNDVMALLRSIAQPLQMIGAETIHGLMIENVGKDFIIKRRGKEDLLAIAMKTILKNAELREEINLEKLSPRVISLPVDLLRYEFFTTHEPVSDEIFTEIVDEIFMPLVRK